MAVTVTHDNLIPDGKSLSEALNLDFVERDSERYPFLLRLTQERLELLSVHKKFNPVFVDFVGGKLRHRRFYGGGRQQLLARAVGMQTGKFPVVLDLNAGLGQDAFVLAVLGCRVTMLERSPIIAALLDDGIQRALLFDWFKRLELTLIMAEARHYLQTLDEAHLPDVIYLDPMFPHRQQSALVKKEMRLLRDVVGDDEDADDLLALALAYARKRVVVKRPRLAPSLNECVPDLVYSGKSSRFDVYLI